MKNDGYGIGDAICKTYEFNLALVMFPIREQCQDQPQSRSLIVGIIVGQRYEPEVFRDARFRTSRSHGGAGSLKIGVDSRCEIDVVVVN